ncbi:MAG: tetratricopeptide repeat protein [Candidatus Melainabacteria bacterium]
MPANPVIEGLLEWFRRCLGNARQTLAADRLEESLRLAGEALNARDIESAAVMVAEARPLAMQQGHNHPAVARLYLLEARLLAQQYQPESAEKRFMHAIEIYEEAYPAGSPDHAQQSQALLAAGDFYRQRGAVDRAEYYYDLARQVFEQAYAGRPDELPAAMNRLGGYYESLQLYDKARRLYQLGLGMTRQAYGSEAPQQLPALKKLALLSQTVHEGERAEQYLLNAMAVARRQLGHGDPELLRLLADLYHVEGRYCEAENCYLEALRICEQMDGAYNSVIPVVLSRLGDFLMAIHRYSDAEEHLTRALEILKVRHGFNHPETQMVLAALAQLKQTEAGIDLADGLGADQPSLFMAPPRTRITPDWTADLVS